MTRPDPFQARATLDSSAGKLAYYDLHAIERAGTTKLARLPYSIRVLLESALRNLDDFVISKDDVERIANWGPETA
ncbi:MAG: hypothetical protein KDB80_03795, partial [Planctomycetes bacterium]|nr:hypothetical protein [Planctomycetota bacterium]